MDRLSLYDYHLPPELIAAHPVAVRDRSRLLVVERKTGEIRHHVFTDLPQVLATGDVMVLNDTRVIPARLFGTRVTTGGKWEGLYLETTPAGTWKMIGQSGGRLRPGERIAIVPAHALSNEARSTPQPRTPVELTLLGKDEGTGIWEVRPPDSLDALEFLRTYGTVPLPPYIGRKRAEGDDWQRYQTIYARVPGAVAAPTAGLHFTEQVLSDVSARGITTATVTLHVGIGTFRPIEAENLGEHRMHAEWFEITAETCRQLEHARTHGGRIVAVGTTSVRTLESASQTGTLQPARGETNLFIRPPYAFRSVDCLLTNFHLPRSSLFVLVCAFAGLELMQQTYAVAIREKYRFYSYGDAMLII